MNIKTTMNKVGFKFKKHSPEILLVSGMVGLVTSTVMACKATTKANDIMEQSKKDVDTIRTVLEDETVEQYTIEDSRKDLAIVYTQTGVKLARTYGPAVILGVLSVSSILASNNILRKRNVALAAAYATVDKSFKEYRKRVVDKFGEEVERELRHDIKATTIEKTVIDEKTGKKKKVKEDVKVVDGKSLGNYAFIFDESNPYWEKDGDYNRMFLSAQQQYANDLLKSKGYLFLNDVLESVGIEGTPEQIKMGQIVGWIYDENNPRGDNYVDFGIFEAYSEDSKNFKKDVANGDVKGQFSEKYRRSIIRDFNVDGNISELMK